MNSKYSVLGSTVRVLGDADEIVDNLPVATFSVKVTMQGFHLEKIPDMEMPSKIYGQAPARADRIMDTYRDRPANTGVLLKGERGSGKTLLIKQVSALGRKLGIPTIIVAAPYSNEAFITFMGSITQEAIVVFDEFDKVYPNAEQETILTLLDGTITGKKLFMFTVNNVSKVNEFFINRPGRIYYSYTYKGLDEEFIREYCKDSLKNQSKIEDIVRVAALFSEFNFDMLKAMVEEINRYDEPVAELLSHLNLTPENGGRKKYKVVTNNFDPVKECEESDRVYVGDLEAEVDDGGYINPLAGSFHICYRFSYRYLETDDDVGLEDEKSTDSIAVAKKATATPPQERTYRDASYVEFEAKHLISIKNDTYTYRNDEGDEVMIRKEKTQAFDYRQFL
ncbi:putative DNA replication protein [Ochrobactrum phage vB_OspM_OC]|nr:putative DNA replication protein [Ochrobactrum phage vB_OspM_OC]